MKRLISVFAVTTTLALAAIPSALADITAAQTDGVWRVTAEGEPLSEVLQTIQSEAGFRLVGADRLVDDVPVTAEIDGTLDDVLARLLAGFDYALVYGETPETENQLQRVVLLSGRMGSAPDESQRLSAERIGGDISEEDGQRVSDLLQRQVQPLIDAESGETMTTASNTGATTSGSADTDSSSSTDSGGQDGAGDYELDAETQAALAEATRRAQQDLQALVNALRAAEDDN